MNNQIMIHKNMRESGTYNLNGDDLKGIYMSSCRETE